MSRTTWSPISWPETVEMILELGGWIHPAVTIVDRGQELGLEVDAVVDDETPLVRIPRSAFLPISRVLWSASEEVLGVDGLMSELTAEQTQLLILQVALHNSCGKISQLVQFHPAITPGLSDDATAAVRAFRPSFRTRFPTPAELFWSNRVFRLPVTPGGAPEPMAVPIIDLLNHRHGGSSARLTEDAFEVSAAGISASGECFLDYGNDRDAIGMAVVYGFADTSNPLAHSAPLTVEIDGVGSVKVLARGRSRAGELRAPRVEATPQGFALSHITFRADQPDRVHRDLSAVSEWTNAQVDAVIGGLRDANIELATVLARAADRDSSRLCFASAAGHQIATLQASR